MISRRGTRVSDEQQILLSRIQGILHAQNYVMIDYNICRENLDAAAKFTPGLTGPTVSPLARDNWVAVRALVPRKEANNLMDKLSAVGAEAILASDLRIARM